MDEYLNGGTANYPCIQESTTSSEAWRDGASAAPWGPNLVRVNDDLLAVGLCGRQLGLLYKDYEN